MTIKISSLVNQQLPEFVRSDNPNFSIFLQKYYEWMERSNNAIGQTQQLYDSKDLDLVNDFYLQHIIDEVLPYFPKETLLDKRKFLKLASDFYKSKGTIDSVKYLFKILYNEDIEIYFPKEQVLKLSDGKWVLPLSLRVETGDLNVFDIEGTKITGEKSKATAVVEKVISSIDRQLGIKYIELYISNVDKLFSTGENVSTTIVRTNGTQDFVTAKLIGSLSEIKIDPKNRGLFYNGYSTELNYAGDPVTIIGGLNRTSGTPVGALATVGSVLTGSVTDIFVHDGGFGFRDPATEPNTSIIDFTGGFKDGIFGAEAKAKILLLDQAHYRTLNVSNITIESMYGSTINGVDNVANNKTINQLTTKQTLNVAPISYIGVESSGGGYKTKPNTSIYSLYMEELADTLIINSCVAIKDTNVLSDSSQDLTQSFEVGEKVRLFVKNKYEEIKTILNVSSTTITFPETFENDINGVSVYKLNRRKLNDVGALGRIKINSGGSGYSVGDYLIFSDSGRGYGANAQVTEVYAGNTGIKAVEFNESSSYIRGGEGYSKTELPLVTVNSSGTGADLVVTEILGEGVDTDLSTSRIGAISSIRVLSYGYDYVEAPTISLRNVDLTLKDVTTGQIFVANTKVYQGTSNANPSWVGYVDKFISSNNFLRVYNYSGSFDKTLELKSDDGLVTSNVITSAFYGDGKAKATAKFENGLIRYPGVYLNTDGQPSSDQKFQDSNKYHNYSYIINTENDYYKFKKTLQEVAHPVGTKSFVTRIDSNNKKITNKQVDIIDLTQTVVSNTFNIAVSSNNMTVTSTLNVQTQISVNDSIILTNVRTTLSGLANIATSSNIITGNGTTFMNDVVDGQTLYLSSGNTIIVKSVIDDTHLYANVDMGITSNNLSIIGLSDITKTAKFVNANTVLVDTNFETTNTYVQVIVQKIR